MIFHNKHLAITDTAEMAQYAFGNLDGWEDFSRKAQSGDILIVGENFGAGSSRQQAVDCFIALGIKAIVGESFGSIYFRNCVNAGLPVFVAKGIAKSNVASGDKIKIDIHTGEIYNITRDVQLPRAKPLAEVQKDIIKFGDLLKLAKNMRK